jgi:hypothetical protein
VRATTITLSRARNLLRNDHGYCLEVIHGTSGTGSLLIPTVLSGGVGPPCPFGRFFLKEVRLPISPRQHI